MKIVRIELVLNNVCNFRCSYCCGGLNTSMSQDIIKIINIERLKFYLDMYLIEYTKYFRIVGGEPLLYPYLDKVYNILAKCKNTYIFMDTNGSIDINNNLLRSLKNCKHNNVEVTFVFSYHKEVLESNYIYMNNYYDNIFKLLDNDIKIRIRMLYDENTYNKIKNFVDKNIKRHFKQNIKIEFRQLFNIDINKSNITPTNTEKCFPYKFWGIFPNNQLYYSCFREIYNNRCHRYDITSKNLMYFIKNIDKEEYVPFCNPKNNILFCSIYQE